MTEPDVTERLFEALSVLPGGPLVVPADLRRRAQRRLRRRRGGTVTVTVAAVLAIVAPLTLLRSGPKPAAHDITPPTLTGGATATQLAKGHWAVYPPAPIKVRAQPMAVWTGTQMIIWGGTRTSGNTLYDDGAAFDVTTNTWSTLPSGPLSPRTAAAAVWTGSEFFLWGGQGAGGTRLDDGATYDPSTQTWQMLPRSPLSGRQGAAAVMVDGEVVVIGGLKSGTEGATDIAAYDPRAHTWRSLPSIAPIPKHHYLGHVSATTTPAGVLFELDWQWSGQTGPGVYLGVTGVDHFLLEHDHLTAVDNGAAPRALGDLVWTGTDVVEAAAPNFNGYAPGPPQVNLHGNRFDLESKAWSPITHGPSDDLSGTSVWTGAALLTVDTEAQTSGGSIGNHYRGEGAAWDPTTDTWQAIPPAPASGAAVHLYTGTFLLEWGDLRTDSRYAGPATVQTLAFIPEGANVCEPPTPPSRSACATGLGTRRGGLLSPRNSPTPHAG